MNEDVEKAVDALDGTVLYESSYWQTVKQALRDQEVEIATLREALREMILVHVVDDDAWDQSAKTERCMQRAIGAARSRITAHLGATNE